MPTVVLLDTSLSMIRPFPCGENGDTTVTLLQLAQTGINCLLDYLTANEKLEFVSLVTFSSVYETYVNFTRDFEVVRRKLAKVEESDEAHIDQGFTGVAKLVLSEWGPSVPCNVILFTDGSSANVNIRSPVFPLPFPFPGRLYVVSMSAPTSSALCVFRRLVEMAGPTQGCVLTPDPGPVSFQAIVSLVKKLVEVTYTTYAGTLKCGNLTARIGLYPAPQNYTTPRGIRVFSETLDIFGFIDLANLASPMTVSRHLVTPLPPANAKPDDDEDNDEQKTPSFCVLIHGALKVENVAALCTVGDDWFGVLYSWGDNKKKCNLMLTVFEPGTDAVPWIGDVRYLGVLEEYPALSKVVEIPTFPVRPSEKRSYSQNSIVWIRKAGLQGDIQKILRHAKKLPDKTQQFYKELNRLRKAAICFGFIELLEGLADILERERQFLLPNAHAECTVQLVHAVEMLRRPSCRDPKFVLTPARTKYSSEHD